MGFNDVEEARVLAKKKNTESVFIGLFVIGVGIGISYLCQFFYAIPISIILAFIIGIFYGAEQRRNYSLKYKEYFVRNSLSSVLTDLFYSPDSGISSDEIAVTEMMHMGDRYSSNDLVEGKYKGISVRQSDVHIEEEHETTDSDGNTHTSYVTIFRGRWMVFDFNKEFKANIQVAQKGFGNNRVNNGGLFFKKKEEEKYKFVKMESADFNKRFKVYAQSEVEAFYILTPSVMEKIINLDEKNSGKILLCFVNNKLHVGLYDNKDSFEAPSPSKKLVEADEFQKINKDLVTITQFVDELNLDNTLFKKSSEVTNNGQVNNINNNQMTSLPTTAMVADQHYAMQQQVQAGVAPTYANPYLDPNNVPDPFAQNASFVQQGIQQQVPVQQVPVTQVPSQVPVQQVPVQNNNQQ